MSTSHGTASTIGGVRTAVRHRMRHTGITGAVVLALAASLLTADAAAQPPAERVAGRDRFATAAAVSAATFDPGVAVAYVATGENFPDALAGGPLAGTSDAPILLSARDRLPDTTAVELARLAPAQIRVLGGPPAVADAVLDALRPLTTGDVVRVEGTNRFATAAAIAVAGFDAGVTEVYVATGANFPDALAGGAAGAARAIPVLLTNPDSIPAETRDALTRLDPGRITVLGGDPVVTETVVEQLQQLTAGDVRRLAGPNRFATAAAIADDTYPDGAPVAYLATGGNFPDALAGAPAAGLAGGPLLLVDPDCAPSETVAAVARLAPDRLVVLGDVGVVSDAAAALQPCGSTAEIPLPTFEVDTTLQPTIAEVPPRVEGDGPRPVARLADELGTTMDFVADELVVVADPGPELDDLLARHDGEIVLSHDLRAAGLGEIADVHLVRIDPSTADPARLGADARATEPLSRGAHGVSSAAGLGTLAASLAATADGMVVGLNALAEGAGILDEVTTEAANASTTFPPAPGQPYSTNAFDWAYMDAGHAQGIGVAEAWRLMAAAGMFDGSRIADTGRSVPVAIIDDGFGRTDEDRPDGALGFGPEGLGPNAPGQFGERGIFGCGGPCPWHGHQVASALAAQVDNARGAAGSGGPVVRLIMVQRAAGVEGLIAALTTAGQNGARIFNMSFGGTVPAAANATLNTLTNVMNVARDTNRLFVASAGNAAIDIDALQCTFDACWEPSTTWPCEIKPAVLCVGGVAAGARTRAQVTTATGTTGSNFGTRGDVEIFGPYTVFVGPNPDAPGDQANTISGTSFAAPVVAGVAALLWAAHDHSQPLTSPSIHTIRQTLIETATTSPDAQVSRILAAPTAVERALATGATGAPTVQLRNPTGDVTVDAGRLTGFEATATDAEDGSDCCTLRWTSDVDGLMSVARTFLYEFPTLGVRTVTVVATDSSGTRSAPVTFRVTAVNPPPVVAVQRPTDGEVLTEGVRSVFHAAISDPNQTDIDCTAVTWAIIGPVERTATRCQPRVQLDAVGAYTVTATGTDEFDATTSVSRTVTVEEYPPDEPPRIVIVNPMETSPPTRYVMGTAIDLHAEATLEPGEVTPIVVGWTVSTPRGTTEIATTTSTSGDVTTATGSFLCSQPGPGGSVEEQTLTFTATDDDGTAAETVTFLCERPLS